MLPVLTLAAVACTSQEQQQASSPLPAQLAGTTWQLVEIQSMDDAVGTLTVDSPAAYTMTLDADGHVSMVLNCNNATGTWTADAASADSGTFRFVGPLAMTRALCPPPSFDEQIARDAEHVRGYLLRDGQLALSLMADGGIYLWQPVP